MPSFRSRAAPPTARRQSPRAEARLFFGVSRRHLLQGGTAAAALLAAERVLAAGKPLASIRRATMRQGDGVAQTVDFGMRGEPRGLDPAFAYDFVANPVVCQITEGLEHLSAYGEPLLLLAETRTVSGDGLQYVYTLRENVRFHDGSPLTAADVVASLARVRDPGLGSPMSWMFDRVAAIEATGEREVTIALETPWPLLPYVLATTAGHVLPAAFLDRGGAAIHRAPVGTGPFRIGDWIAGDRIVLARNEEYWGSEGPFFAAASFVFIPDDADRIGRYLEGELNGLVPDALTLADYDALAEASTRKISGQTAVFIAFRCDQAPFDDPEVRRAIARAVDVDTLFAETIGATGMCGTNSLTPSNVYLPCSNAGLFDPVPFQLDAARETVGRLRPQGFQAVLNVLDEEPWRTTGREVARALTDRLGDLGVTVVANPLPYAEYVELERTGVYEGMLLATWASDFPDASASLRPLFRSGGPLAGRNLFSYENLAVDERIDRAQGDVVLSENAVSEALDREARCALLLEAQQQIAADQPYVLIGHFNWFMPLDADLGGHEFGPFWFWDGFLRNLRRGGDDQVLMTQEFPPTDHGPVDCQSFLRDQLDWMRGWETRVLALSAISIHPSGEVGVAHGAFTCRRDDAGTDADSPGPVLAGHGRWYREPRSRTDWEGLEIEWQLTSSEAPDPELTVQLVPAPELGPALPLRLVRCNTGVLVGVGPWPGDPATENGVFLLSLRRYDPDQGDDDATGGVDDPESQPAHSSTELAPCSSEATFLLARAFRRAREAPAETAVRLTFVSNEPGTIEADESLSTHPGFHSTMTILSTVLDYAPDDDAETILGMPSRSFLRGFASRGQSNFAREPSAGGIATPSASPLAEDGAPAAPPTSPPAPTPTPALPGGVCAAWTPASDPAAGPPFWESGDYRIEIIETIRLSGPSYEVTLQWHLGHDAADPVTLQELRVVEGVLIGMAPPFYGFDHSGSAPPIEYAIGLALGDRPPATPVPTATPTPVPEPTSTADIVK